MKNTARLVGSIVNGLKSYARSVGARFVLLTLQEKKHATRVVGIKPLDVSRENPLVFDLTVENHHCYLANGLLVSNSNFSDAYLQLAVGMRRAGIHMDNNPGVFGMSDGELMDIDEDLPIVEPWTDNTGVFA